ncbi:MAG: dTDP-4-dehydrorhamnose 3,5-epimerase family protein [Candidatus Binataceae bacterium]
MTLRDNTEVFYQMSEFHAPASERGLRWNDPLFSIKWPIEPRVVSGRDRCHPDFID